MWYAHDVGWAWWLLMSLGMVAFWGLLIYGVVLLARRGSGPSAPEAPPPEAPLNVLQRRLAAGEISVEEYERLRDALLDPPHRVET